MSDYKGPEEMTRADCEQMIADSTPGRFEGEQPWTAYYHAWSMEGMGEMVYDDDDDDSGESELLYIEFEPDEKEIALFPELRDVGAVRLYTSGNGFISTELGPFEE